MKLQDPMKTVRSLVGDGAIKSDRCCGESGTLAVSRPDVSTQVRFRKQEELLKGAETLRGDGYNGDVKVLTSRPSCLQGLSRYEGDTGMDADYIVVEMARHPGRRLDGRLCAPRQRGRHRARAGVAVTRRLPAGIAVLQTPGGSAGRFAARRQRRPMACMVTMYQITLSLNLLLMARRLMPRFPHPDPGRLPGGDQPARRRRAAARIRSAPGRRC